MFAELVRKNRSFRRFHQEAEISEEALRGLVDLARHTASGANLQPLRYLLSFEAERNAVIYPHLAWAAYLKDWDGPVEGERPSAYIVVFGDTETSKDFGCDHGIAAQTILLGAAEQGLGGCMIASVQREKLQEALAVPSRYKILLVLALGKPKETVVLEEVGSSGDIRYWRDADGVHHVPKRSLEDLIL